MENCNFYLALLSMYTCPLGQNLPSPAELNGRQMHGILLNINRKSEFVTGVDDDEVKHTLQKFQDTMKWNFDRKHNVQEHTPLLPGTPVMVQRKKGDIWTHGMITCVPKPYVHERHGYKIILPSGRIITKNSSHVC